MKAATYTEQQIIEAGERLLKDGKNATPFAIRNLLGGGNPARIRSIWDAHGASLVVPVTTQQEVDLPAEFGEVLEGAKSGLYKLAQSMYGRAQEIAETRARDTIAQAKAAQQTASLEVADAVESLEQADQKCSNLELELSETRESLRKAQADALLFKERFDAAEQAHQKQETLARDAAREVAEALAEVARYHERAEQAEKQITQLQAIVEKLSDK